MKRLMDRKVTRLGAAQAVNCFNFREGLFPLEKTCKLSLVRGTILFYNQKLQILACSRKCYVECINAFK